MLGEAAFRQLHDRSAIPTFAIDHEHRMVVLANRAGLDLLELEAADVIGHPGADFLLETSPDRVLRSRAIRGDDTVIVREVKTASGRRTVEVHIVASGVDGVMFAQVIDLTDILDAAARAEERAAELEERCAALEEIATRLAHDLSGPMAAIAGIARLLLGDDHDLDAAERTHLLQRISANADALATMTRTILSDASSEASPHDSSDDVEDLFAALRGVTEAQLAEIQGTLETRAVVTTLPVPVGAVRQTLINLVSNSIKYRHPTRLLRIEVEVGAVPGGAEIIVRDNGLGLPEDPTELFDAGLRGPSAEGTTGAGLGLAFARAAVEGVGGTLAGRSTPSGAEFSIVLPHPGVGDVAPVTEDADGGLTASELARIIDASPVATLIIDITRREIVRVNRAGVDLLGPEGTILGRPGSDFVDVQGMTLAIQQQLVDDPGAAHAVRMPVRTASGQRPATVWLAIVSGTSLAVVHIIQDEEN